ncbi:Raf kinase inhibitor-like protein, YbhB/YbcL family [Paraburkholderia piptadeniae]|uniref:Raf kinase inhibitor-like protein, YbhB/YbcL family n=1 Tax=Paraburkholderia piptadeniae TaxID=1701573 RepID=A0A1N7SAX3_9BURK|nr:YbhB/YbcL family Raf kinase inhibitor-like protein [Paraburkholderia piptadeniae]SIT44471.1 Raf kinase inhibitor-like protein, YbhB/YbcL family [Paraburkholderia piptadeniae]
MRLRCPVVTPASSRSFLPFLSVAPSRAASVIAFACAVHASTVFADSAFTVTSTSFRAGGTVNNAQVFDRDDCKGNNYSPQLSWHNPPDGTRSFAITIFDPDAPGRGWWHWAVVGIPANVDRLPENASASGFLKKLGAVEARNDFDIDGYGGPCPPPGKPHRYVITVYALSAPNLRLAQGRPSVMFDHEISTATLGYARMTVMYGR